MNPPCARCKKTVYPVEKLNCLDQYWHKGCFTCEVCNMVLNMKTYRGYKKTPYCSAHYPTTSFTPEADTPETRRLNQQTPLNNQSKWNHPVPGPRPLVQPAGRMRPPPAAPPSGGNRYQAMYSYAAADGDEVSLQEGDLILDVEPIDAGWMSGRNQRTGQRGLLPTNYVRPV